MRALALVAESAFVPLAWLLLLMASAAEEAILVGPVWKNGDGDDEAGLFSLSPSVLPVSKCRKGNENAFRTHLG